MVVICKVDPGYLKLEWHNKPCRFGLHPGILFDA